MNEEDILNLKLAGYTVKDGVILDADGNYLSSVDLNDVTYNSADTEEDYNYAEEQDAKITLERTLAEEKKTADKAKLEEYSDNPYVYANLDDVSEESYDEYMQEKVDAGLPGAYKFKEDFIQETEEKALEADLKNNLETGEPLQTKAVFNGLENDAIFKDKGINWGILEEVIPAEKAIKEIEEGDDVDMDTWLGKEMKSIQKELDESAWYNP